MAVLIDACRVCKGPLQELWELGEFALCGYFPSPGEDVPVEPMGLSWCPNCDLTQMHYRYEQFMYGERYGYRSGLNPTMVAHLHEIARYGQVASDMWLDDVALDIGGNDGTLLSYFGREVKKVLIDPTAKKWSRQEIYTVDEPFSVPAYHKASPNRKAQLVTSIAMFYDLDDPVQFARDVARCMATDGVWILEQSHLASMVEANAFDTICHEHLEYYSMAALANILRKAGLYIHEAGLNDCNGGSIRLLVRNKPPRKAVEPIDLEWNTQAEFSGLVKRVDDIKCKLKETLAWTGRTVGWGASTKGNTLLQHFGITKDQIPYIVDANPEKWGKVTPGTKIPIQQKASDVVDSYLVLPWHFRRFVIEKERDFLMNGGKLIFPLPEVEVVTWDTLSGHE